ncbi:MAG TPA: deoxyribodipyrimidine photo-lyase [Deltaproteobacteria bacterium]|nr:deoxyribodipyrimidine photo-lyase [Deltaproteobacteria bacterium]
MRALHWFRADLRLRDNLALEEAARADECLPFFVLDEAILRGSRTGAPRVRFLLECLRALRRELAARGSTLLVLRGDPAAEIARLLGATRAELVTWGRCETPLARRRDARVRAVARRAGARTLETKDDVVFGSEEVRTRTGGAFAVYTPYRNAWEARLLAEPQPPRRAPRLPPPIPNVEGDLGVALPSPEELGFGESRAELPVAGEEAAHSRLERFLSKAVRSYTTDRDMPAREGTSRLSPYLRFGVISARACVSAARACADDDRSAAEGSRKWVDELVWREFYRAILAENPRVQRGCYRKEYDALAWNEDPEAFAAWCQGRTGYPIVDAAMRELAATGWMHNRLRMIVASFLTKDLLLDWRLGERFFFRALVDGDPASNNGGWQWSASTGSDAQPYFRIFNPVSQGLKFDREGSFVRRWVPELEGVDERFLHAPWEMPHPPKDYPPPMVSHAERRRTALRRFEAVRRAKEGARRRGA